MNPIDLIIATLARLNPTPFVIGWIETRPWRLLVAAIPVVVAISAAIAVRASMNAANSDYQFRHYLTSAGEALRDGDEKAAELCFRRAALINPADPRPKFGLATMAEQQGDLAKANAIMESLASGQDTVAAQANRWLISKTKLDALDAAGGQRLIRRLERAVQFEPQNVEYRLSLAGVYARAGLLENAVSHLRVAAQSRPQLRISVIQMLANAGNEAAVREEAAAAERYYRDRLLKEPSELETRLLCSSALVFQKKYPDAIKVLEQGSSLNDPVVIRKALSAVLIAWARELQSKKDDSKRILELTSSALKADPSNSAALMMLTDLSRDGAAGDDAVAQLQEQLAAGQTPWLIHMILGTRMLELGKTEEGARHLEQAVNLNPSAAIAMNNLAWTLATQEPADLDRASQLADRAVALAPTNPQIRETRGQISLKQGRWKEALTDLEAVLPIYVRKAPLMKQLPHLHESLARAYEELGNQEMARQHRELALDKAAERKDP